MSDAESLTGPCYAAQREGKQLLGRGRPPVRWVSNQQNHADRITAARGSGISTHPMILPVGPSPSGWMLTPGRWLARSGPEPGALGRQLSALKRRQQLQVQQRVIQAGQSDYQALPPYPPRPRPPA